MVLIIIALAGVSLFLWRGQAQVKTDTAGSTLRQSSKSQTQTDSPTPAVIILSTSKNSVKVGEIFAVSINISSKNRSAGTDIIMIYDPNLLSVEVGTSDKPVQVGSIYQDYPVNSNDSNNGRIVVSGISSQSEGSLTSGLFGVVNFKAKKSGKTAISLDFAKGSTTDSNVTESESSTDILEAVQNAEVLVN